MKSDKEIMEECNRKISQLEKRRRKLDDRIQKFVVPLNHQKKEITKKLIKYRSVLQRLQTKKNRDQYERAIAQYGCCEALIGTFNYYKPRVLISPWTRCKNIATDTLDGHRVCDFHFHEKIIHYKAPVDPDWVNDPSKRE